MQLLFRKAAKSGHIGHFVNKKVYLNLFTFSIAFTFREEYITPNFSI